MASTEPGNARRDTAGGPVAVAAGPEPAAAPDATREGAAELMAGSLGEYTRI